MWGRKSLPSTIVHPLAGAIAIKFHPRAKRLRLSFRFPSNFSITVPPGATERSIQNFISQTETWIVKQLSNAAPLESSHKDHFCFQGVLYQIKKQSIPGRDLYKFDHEQRVLNLYTLGEDPSRRLAYVCRKEFQKILPATIEKYSKLMNLVPTKVALKDTKSRWGSCSSAGHISLSWRLIMAPKDVMEYVIIHELAHLKHMDHSPSFWGVVSQYCPDYAAYRLWLKENSRLLHSF